MIICSFEMFKHKSIFFKDFASVLISWLQKMHVTSMYTYTHTNAHMYTHMPHPCVHVHTETHTCTHKCMWVCTHMCVHTHTPLLALTLSPCFDYIPINSQNNFFTNCVLSILCCLWLPVLIKIKNKAWSLAIKVWCDLTFNSSALAVLSNPLLMISHHWCLAVFPTGQAHFHSWAFFLSLKCSLLVAGSSFSLVTPSEKLSLIIQLEVSLSRDIVLWWYSAHFCIYLLKSVSSARLSVKRKA